MIKMESIHGTSPRFTINSIHDDFSLFHFGGHVSISTCCKSTLISISKWQCCWWFWLEKFSRSCQKAGTELSTSEKGQPPPFIYTSTTILSYAYIFCHPCHWNYFESLPPFIFSPLILLWRWRYILYYIYKIILIFVFYFKA
jgi:hypothetical protein